MARSPLPHAATPGTSLPSQARTRSIASDLLLSLRPGQWTKNLLIFAGLVFGQQLFNPVACLRAMAGFFVFCGLSGIIYLMNDVADREADRHHPLKAHRPIATGRLPVRTAVAAAAVIGALALAAALWLGPAFAVVAGSYTVLLGLYSVWLKHLVILDVLTISMGFVLRAVGGAVVIGVPFSHWLLVCTTLLALFLALSKRRHEVVLLADNAPGHRPALDDYNPYLLDQMISVVTASTLIAYTFYTISEETIAKFQTDWLGLTVPFPLYGIFRYLYLVHHKERGGDPSDLLLNDRPLLICVALWGLALIAIIYRPFGS